MKEEIKNLINAGRLYRAIRGEEVVFETPSEINGNMRPTDHIQLLTKAIYPLCKDMGIDQVKRGLENGLREAASDALGVYCSVQCYFHQIVHERRGESPFGIDRISLPLFLGEQFEKCKSEFLSVKLESYFSPDAALLLTSRAIAHLRRDEAINIG